MTGINVVAYRKKLSDIDGHMTYSNVKIDDDYEPLVTLDAATKAIAERDAEIERLEKALTEIASQKKTDELESIYDVETASFEDGYDLCIDRARAALETRP